MWNKSTLQAVAIGTIAGIEANFAVNLVYFASGATREELPSDYFFATLGPIYAYLGVPFLIPAVAAACMAWKFRFFRSSKLWATITILLLIGASVEYAAAPPRNVDDFIIDAKGRIPLNIALTNELAATLWMEDRSGTCGRGAKRFAVPKTKTVALKCTQITFHVFEGDPRVVPWCSMWYTLTGGPGDSCNPATITYGLHDSVVTIALHQAREN